MNIIIPNDESSPVIMYKTEDGQTRVDVKFETETAWMTQKAMGMLFEKARNTITEHIQNVFEEGELEENSVCRFFRHTASDGKEYNTKYYNLDVIISVGYRVKSKQGTDFRIWATKQLKELLLKGFVLDDKRLKDPSNDYFDELLKKIKEIRASERRFYQKITDLYATSEDYESNSETTKLFFKIVQNKLLYAITGKTAAEIIADRASADKQNMGLTTWEGKLIRKNDIKISKNYLLEVELEDLNSLVDEYLSYGERMARRRKTMKMEDWKNKIDDFLKFNEMNVLGNAGKIAKKLADELAGIEYGKYKETHPEEFRTDFDKEVAKFAKSKKED